MKNLLVLICLIGIVSCKKDKNVSEKLSPVTESTNDNKQADPINDLELNDRDINFYIENDQAFTNSENGNPIEDFKIVANQKALKTINLTKDNFSNSLTIASNFENIFITVEDHTIVKIEELSNCKPSISWATCVPYAHGYIKKGEMIYKEDFANNIIGIPDQQQRTMYLFH